MKILSREYGNENIDEWFIKKMQQYCYETYGLKYEFTLVKISDEETSE